MSELRMYGTMQEFLYLFNLFTLTSINILWEEYSMQSPSLNKLLSSCLVVWFPHYIVLTKNVT